MASLGEKGKNFKGGVWWGAVRFRECVCDLGKEESRVVVQAWIFVLLFC